MPNIINQLASVTWTKFLWSIVISAIYSTSAIGSTSHSSTINSEQSLETLQSIKQLRLPKPIANNAVASATVNNEVLLYSFNGLEKGKQWQDVSNVVYEINLTRQTVNEITPKKPWSGRLASIATTVNEQIYLFGGYTVDEKGGEVSTPEVIRFSPESKLFEVVTQMPVPVDDSVALTYRNRYIYLISGWHNHGNVKNVQIYDTQENQWMEGTPYPGAPVFGHAAGIVGNIMIVADGVKVAAVVDGKRQFAMSPESYIGVIDEKDLSVIHWQKLPSHPGLARYRMAAIGDSERGEVLFAGGSDNPYNFNGIGYNGVPSEPSSEVFSWNIRLKQWQTRRPLTMPTMDHRGLLKTPIGFILLGGMGTQQKVLDTLQVYNPE